jgi:hypothetical protein
LSGRGVEPSFPINDSALFQLLSDQLWICNFVGGGRLARKSHS